MTEETPETTETTDVATYGEIEAEVGKRFAGSWEAFLKAVENPAEILQFILARHFGKDTDAFEAWAKEKQLPPDWVPRFYSTLDADGELRPAPAQAD